MRTGWGVLKQRLDEPPILLADRVPCHRMLGSTLPSQEDARPSEHRYAALQPDAKNDRAL